MARKEAEGGENYGDIRLPRDARDATSLMSMKWDHRRTATVDERESRVGCPSVRRLPIDGLVQQGDGSRKLRLSGIQLGLDLPTLTDLASVTKLGPQFLDLDFNVVGHRLISVSVKDDVNGREGMAGSGIAQATGRAGEWGSRFSEGAVGGWRKLGEPLILEAVMRERHTPVSEQLSLPLVWQQNRPDQARSLIRL